MWSAIITVNYPGQTRQSVGFLYPLTWEFNERQCLYVGNGQVGPIDDLNNPVLQGEYTDYWGECERAPPSGVAGRNICHLFVCTIRRAVNHLQLLFCA